MDTNKSKAVLWPYQISTTDMFDHQLQRPGLLVQNREVFLRQWRTSEEHSGGSMSSKGDSDYTLTIKSGLRWLWAE